jgi:hypothetical protein
LPRARRENRAGMYNANLMTDEWNNSPICQCKVWTVLRY